MSRFISRGIVLKMFYLWTLAVCILGVNVARGMEKSVCPESKKQYPRDCRLLHKCVQNLNPAQASTRVIVRCSADGVLREGKKKCVRGNWNCQQDHQDSPDNKLATEKTGKTENTTPNLEAKTRNEAPLTGEKHIFVTYNPEVLNAQEQDKIPLSVVDSASIDQIKYQLQLINSIIRPNPASKTYEKVVPTLPQKPPRHSIPSPYYSLDSLKYKMNLHPSKLNTIIAQLTTPLPLEQKELLNQHLSPDHIAAYLFQKYLTKGSFISHREFVKESPVLIPVTKRPSFSPASIIQLPASSPEEPCSEGEGLPNPEDCTQYFRCNAFTTKLQKFICPAFTAFSPRRQKCDTLEYRRCVERNPYPKKEMNTIMCGYQMCGGLQILMN